MTSQRRIVEYGETDRAKLDAATHYKSKADGAVLAVTGRQRCPVCHRAARFDLERDRFVTFNRAHVMAGCARKASAMPPTERTKVIAEGVPAAFAALFERP